MADGTVKIAVTADEKQALESFRKLKAGADGVGNSSGPGKLKGEIDALPGASNQATVGFKNMVGAMALVKLGSVALGAVKSGLGEILRGLNESSSTWQTFNGNMKAFGKSSQEINKVKKDLQSYAEATIYSSSEMASTYAQLAAVGVKNTTQLVKGFGGLAAAAENPKQAMKSMSQQATQMASKPKVAWEDFKIMLDQTPAGMSAVAKSMGTDLKGLVKGVQDGTVKTDDFFKAITKAGNSKAFSDMATKYKTVGDAVDGLTETLTNKLQPSFDKISKLAIGWVSKFTDMISQIDFGGIVDGAINTFTKLGGVIKVLAPFILPVVAAIGAFAGTIMVVNKVTSAINGIKGAFTALKVVLSANPFALVIAGLVLLGVALYTAYQKSETFRNIVNGMGQAIVKMAAPLKPLIAILGNFGTAIGIMATMVKGYFTDFGGTFQKARESLVDAFGAETAGKITKTMVSILGPISDFILIIKSLAGVATGSIKNIDGLYDALGGAVSTEATKKIMAVGEAIKNFVSGLANFKIPDGLFSLKLLVPVLGLLFPPLKIITLAFGLLSQVLGNGAVQNGLSSIVDGFSKLGSGILAAAPAIGNGVGALIGGILTAIAVALPQIIVGGLQVVSALAMGIAQGLPSLAVAASALILSITGSLLLLMPTIIASGAALIVSFIMGLTSQLPMIIVAVGQLITTFLLALAGQMPGIILAGLTLLTSIIQGIIQGLPQLIIAVGTLITTFLTGIAGQMPGIVAAGMMLLISFLQGIISKLPNLIATVARLIVTFLDSITSHLPAIIDSGVKLILAWLSGIAKHLPDIIAGAMSVMIAFLQGIARKLPALITAAVDVVVAFLNGIASNLGRIITAGVNIVVALIEGIANNVSKVVKAVFDLMGSIAEAVGHSPKEMVDVGVQFVKGFINGIGEMVGDAVNAAANMAKKALESVKGFLGIHSPSREMAALGRFTGQGFANGITGMIGTVGKASDKLASAALIDTKRMNLDNVSMPALEGFRNGTITAETMLSGSQAGKGVNYSTYNSKVNNTTNNVTSENISKMVDKIVASNERVMGQLKNLSSNNQTAIYLDGDKVSRNTSERQAADYRSLSYLEGGI